MVSRPAPTPSATALLTVLLVLGWIFGAVARAGTIATRMPSERTCRVAWNAGTNKVSRHRLAASGPWKSALVVGGAAASTVTIPGTPSQRVGLRSCLLLARNGDRAREVIGRWRHGSVAEWTFSPVFQLTVRVTSNGRILHDGRLTKA